MAQRWAVVRMLEAGMHYAEISRRTGASTATITRIASWLHHGEGGYRLMLDRSLKTTHAGPEARESRVTATRPVGQPCPIETTTGACGSPSRTRAASSSRRSRCLHDAGLVFEEHERSLVARVQNYDLDILFVRTNDIVEFVGDGVADLGITGIDLLAETGAELPTLRDLGFGRCRLAAAVPSDSPVPERRGSGRRRGSRRLTRTRHAGSSPSGASPSRSSRSRAPSRSRRDWASPMPSSTSSRPARRW